MVRTIITGMIGSVLGGVLAVIAGVLTVRLLLSLDASRASGWEDLIYGLLAVIVFYPLGVGLTGGLVFRRTAGRGMIWKAVLAACAGEALVLLLAEPLRLNLTTNLMAVLLFLLPPLMVLLAYRLNRPAG